MTVTMSDNSPSQSQSLDTGSAAHSAGDPNSAVPVRSIHLTRLSLSFYGVPGGYALHWQTTSRLRRHSSRKAANLLHISFQRRSRPIPTRHPRSLHGRGDFRPSFAETLIFVQQPFRQPHTLKRGLRSAEVTHTSSP